MAMNINDSFRYMQDYRINDIPRVDAPKPEPAQVKENTEAAKPSVTIEPVEDRRPRSVDPNEVSLSFNKNNKIDKEIDYKKEYEKILNSKTFKLGDKLLKIPRKVKSIVIKRRDSK